MSYRKKLDARPWLTNKAYDLLTRPVVAHYDLYAFIDKAGWYWYAVELRKGGKDLLARSVYRLDHMTALLDQRAQIPELTATRWTRFNNATMRCAHRQLLAICTVPEKFEKTSVYCHYITPLDCDPWPDGFNNAYTYSTRNDDPRRGPRVPDDAEPTIVLTPVFGVLPHVL